MYKSTNIEWPMLKTAVSAAAELNYKLSYWGNDETGYSSGKNPSFNDEKFILKHFQIIWNRDNPKEIFINHGFPDVFDKVKEMFSAVGFIIVNHNPNGPLSARVQEKKHQVKFLHQTKII
jgi:DNA modification methylase